MSDDYLADQIEAKKIELLRLGRRVDSTREQLRMMVVEVQRLIRRAEQTQRALTESMGAASHIDPDTGMIYAGANTDAQGSVR